MNGCINSWHKKLIKDIQTVHSTAQATGIVLASDIAGDSQRILLQQWPKDIVKDGIWGQTLNYFAFLSFNHNITVTSGLFCGSPLPIKASEFLWNWNRSSKQEQDKDKSTSSHKTWRKSSTVAQQLINQQEDAHLMAHLKQSLLHLLKIILTRTYMCKTWKLNPFFHVHEISKD